jgi:hypothetical protein
VVTAINIWRSDKPSRVSHGRIEPMRREDAIFWRWRADRKAKERKHDTR